MNRLKRWFIGAALAISSALGIQYARPPTLQHDVVMPKHVQKKLTLGDIAPSINVSDITGASKSEEDMIKQGFNYANEVIMSKCFTDKVLSAHFTEDNDYTNQQILDLLDSKPIVTGAEFFDGDWKQDYWYKTMGYDVGDGVVYMNRFFIDTPELVGSLVLHEVAHQLGFHHYGQMDTSVPYQFNDFFDACVVK